jgi:hypothetical protein
LACRWRQPSPLGPRPSSWPPASADPRGRKFGRRTSARYSAGGAFRVRPCEYPALPESSLSRAGAAWMAGSSPARTAEAPRQVGSRRPTATAIRATNCLDKIRNVRKVFPLTESYSRSSKNGRKDEKPWLFETLVHNLPREPGRGGDFLNYIAHNPLKRLD